MHYLIYKITNLVNGKNYIGAYKVKTTLNMEQCGSQMELLIERLRRKM